MLGEAKKVKVEFMVGEEGSMQLHFAPADEELVLAALKDGSIQVVGSKAWGKGNMSHAGKGF